MTLFVSLYLLSGPSTILNLLVDTLLNVVALSMFALVYYYLKEPEKITIPLSFGLVFLTLIKNSGVFFAVLAIIIYVYGVIKYRNKRLMKKDYQFMFPIFSPLTAFYFWSRHVALVFSKLQLGKHSMNIESYLRIYGQKNQDEINMIYDTFLERLLSDYMFQFITILLLLIILLLLNYFVTKKIEKRLLISVALIFTVFILYNIGLFAMYLVSMPINEALTLAGYSRYMVTILNYLVGIFSISVLYYLSKEKHSYLITIGSIVSMLFFGYLSFGGENLGNTLKLFQNETLVVSETNPTFANIDAGLTHLPKNPMRSVEQEKTYVFYYPSSDRAGLTNYYLKYRLYQSNFKVIKTFDDISNFWEYDYFVVTIITPEVEQRFAQFSNLKPELGTYRLEEGRILEKVK